MTNAIRKSFAATFTMIAMYVTIACLGTPTPAPALAVHDAQFELEGDVADDADPKADWASIFDSNGDVAPTLPPNFLSSQFTRDFVAGSSADTSTFSGGSRDTLNISTGWECAQSNNALDKADLLDTYATFYVDPATSETMLYFGAERFDNSGAGSIGVWFLQDPTVGWPAAPPSQRYPRAAYPCSFPLARRVRSAERRVLESREAERHVGAALASACAARRGRSNQKPSAIEKKEHPRVGQSMMATLCDVQLACSSGRVCVSGYGMQVFDERLDFAVVSAAP